MKTYYRLTTREIEKVNWINPFYIMFVIGNFFLFCSGKVLLGGIYLICFLLILTFFEFKIEKKVVK